MVNRYDVNGKEGSRLDLNEILAVSGGAVGVSIDDTCHKKKGTFKSLRNENICTNKCKDCWHLKFKDGFYCDA